VEDNKRGFKFFKVGNARFMRRRRRHPPGDWSREEKRGPRTKRNEEGASMACFRYFIPPEKKKGKTRKGAKTLENGTKPYEVRTRPQYLT